MTDKEFEDAARRYAGNMRRVAHKQLRANQDLVDDAVSEALLLLWTCREAITEAEAEAEFTFTTYFTARRLKTAEQRFWGYKRNGQWKGTIRFNGVTPEEIDAHLERMGKSGAMGRGALHAMEIEEAEEEAELLRQGRVALLRTLLPRLKPDHIRRVAERWWLEGRSRAEDAEAFGVDDYQIRKWRERAVRGLQRLVATVKQAA